MRIVISLSFFCLFVSCIHRSGDYGATVGDCDDICTVYHIAQKKIYEKYNVYDKDFPDKKTRRSHVEIIPDGYKINSWFRLIYANNDSTYIKFTCEVYLDLNSDLGYIVKNMRIKN